MSDEVFDYLSRIAKEIRYGDEEKGLKQYGTLSRSEEYYVAIAANRADLLGKASLVDAINRLGTIWINELILRHQYD